MEILAGGTAPGARTWPVGTARIVVALSPHADGTLVTVDDAPATGPARPAPARSAPPGQRNREAPARLEARACNRPS